ncbi:hypothetical protein TraAM80_01078 [Trypanosoma rangeli]|uniref:Uncharacterized protein n=1 Tax=Trypanosoma rangeli TaxID=5698 RepID=A0A3R7P1B5_TRYRA|nr:uncharacterized protein TraAM80_01078 [Trypanosoma rangeli]RNF11111.1 hypothetical protein TraAM80_01078 [Trypanosoma rangeli]|eukprot:RNF11111.1 hypothetical protein TraAM80_01078 [Trypanosoma rangeli]
MIITEAVFACFREWHHDVVASAFFADNEDVLFLLSSMNVVPGAVRAQESGESTTVLAVHTRCCQGSRLFSEPERLQLLQLLQSPLLIQEDNEIFLVGNSKNMDESQTEDFSEPDGRSIINRLLRELHLSSCWWRQGEFVRHMLNAPRFSPTNNSMISHRCAAVLLTDATSASPQGTSLALTPGGGSNAVKLLLPRGSPPSFIRSALVLPLVECLRTRMAQTSSRLRSSAPMNLLRVIFALKRARSSEEENGDSGDESEDLVLSLSLLLALLGYTLSRGVSQNTCELAVNPNSWEQLCVDMRCHFCGGRPQLTLEKMVADEYQEPLPPREQNTEGEEVTEGDEKTSSEKGKIVLLTDSAAQHGSGEAMSLNCPTQVSEKATAQLPVIENEHGNVLAHVAPLCIEDAATTSSSVRFHHTIHLSEQEKISGHHRSCPWKALFLRSVLADVIPSTPSKEILFELYNATGEGGSLRICFKLSEVAKLMECWRRSLYAESVWRENYIKHPLPVVLPSLIPSSAGSETEAFLAELASRSAGDEGLKLGPLIPLFDDRSPWDSYFRVASFLKASTSVDNGEGEGRAMDAAESNKPPKVEGGGHWKAVYDMGRRYILAAADETNQETGVELLAKFKEQYQNNVQQGATGGHASSPLQGVMCKLFHLLREALNIDSPHGRKAILEGSSEGQQIPVQEQKRVHSFLDALDDVVERVTQETLLTQTEDQVKHPASFHGNSNESTPKKEGVSRAQHKQQKQHQQYKQHQHQQQQQRQHHKQQQQKQKQQLCQQGLQQPWTQQILLPPSSAPEGVFPFSAMGPGGGVLPTPRPILQQPQPPPFQPAVLGGESMWAMDNTYMQRPSVMGQSRAPVTNPALERKGGRGGNHRGGRSGGRGGRGGGNAFRG